MTTFGGLSSHSCDFVSNILVSTHPWSIASADTQKTALTTTGYGRKSIGTSLSRTPSDREAQREHRRIVLQVSDFDLTCWEYTRNSHVFGLNQSPASAP